MALTFPEIPAKVKDYLWVLVAFAAFTLLQVVALKLGGTTPPPAPPVTVNSPPAVVVQEDWDGNFVILDYSPRK